MQYTGRHGGFFHLFGIIRFLPYVAIGFLIIAVAIWIVFGIKKFKWSKILAIVLTVFVVIFAALSISSFFLGRNMAGKRMSNPNGQHHKFQPSNSQNQDTVQTSSLFYDFRVDNEILSNTVG